MKWVTGKEFAEWMAYYALEPFGQEAENWRTAQLLAMLWNINSKKKRSPEDFMPKVGGDTAPTPDVVKKKLDVLMAAWGGRMTDGSPKPAKPPKPKPPKPEPVQPVAPPTRRRRTAPPRPKRETE